MEKNSTHQVKVEYEKITHHEHILKLPDTYIGSVKLDQMDMWVYDDIEKKMARKNISYVPGLYKIFDEILVNAHDHAMRDASCKTIKVNIDQKRGEISVWNDGNGILVEINKKEKIYNPELIFGNLLTSSNYKQTGKTWGGKNGYGAKLTNIYSTHFYVDTLDVVSKKRYTQHFYENMYKKDKAEIMDIKKTDKPYTKITFIPDYARFGLDGLTDDIVCLFQKRVFDIAACDCKRAKVYLNDELINICSFGDYIKLFFPNNEDGESAQIVYKEINDCWKIGVVYTPNSGFSHVSHVNGVCTYSPAGGTHVQHATDQIIKGLLDYIKIKHKNVNIKPAYLKENMTVFVDCTTADPDFSSQTKECLTTKISSFLKRCDIDDNFIIAISKTNIVEDAINFANIKESAELKKTDGKKIGRLRDIPKLEDANWAGKRRSKECRLIIVEGDSAKTFAIDGLSVIGRDRYGVFPIRGKLLNVRDATKDKIANNAEIKNIKRIIGLKQGEVYTEKNINKLRYGGILLLTDADVDGSHIKGLVINFIHYFWPELLKIKGFFQTMATPIVKSWRKKSPKTQKIFYNLIDYEKWVGEQGAKINQWDVKYYKGLGTSTQTETIDVFREFDVKLMSFIWDQTINPPNDMGVISVVSDGEMSECGSDCDDDVKSTSDKKITIIEKDKQNNSKSSIAINLAFSKSLADDRKKWLGQYNRSVTLIPEKQEIRYDDFINKELIHFSNYDNIRSIPSMCDGFKPSQRKILFTVLEKGIDNRRVKEVKVMGLSSIVQERTNYIHGETSLQEAIIKMAQIFVGSNNINTLHPNGQFGTRTQGGENAGAPRYIFTYLGDLTRKIFRKEDEQIYKYLVEENKIVEPETFAPIIPMVLVNGAHGIGTGFSTHVPCYNPIDIVNNLMRLMNDETQKTMKPWYRGFTGSIVKKDDYTYVSHGVYNMPENGDTVVNISELPIGVWTDDYKEFLDKISDDKNDRLIDDYKSDSGSNFIDFTLSFSGNSLQKLIKNKTLEQKLKLTSSISTANMYLYDADGKMTKYDTPEDILESFYDFRLSMYEKRKEYYLKLIKNELDILNYKIKFIKMVCDDKIIIAKRSRSNIIEQLVDLKFPKLSHDINAVDVGEQQPIDNDDDNVANKVVFKTYDYVTKLSLFSISEDDVRELEKQQSSKKEEYDVYKNLTAKDIWKSELNDFIDSYNKWYEKQEKLDKIANFDKSVNKKSKKRNAP